MKTGISLIILMAFILTFSEESRAVDFGMQASINWGLGKMGRQTDDRTINTFNASLLTGVRFMNQQLLVGPQGLFQAVGQVTDPASVENTNVKGSGYLLGMSANWTEGLWSVSGGVDFFGKYSFNKKTISNQELSYSKPIGGRIAVGYQLFKGFWLEALVSYTAYGVATEGSTEATGLSPTFVQTHYGLGASLQY